MISAVKPTDVALLIFISSPDDEHFDNLVHVPPQSVKGVEIVDPSSGNSNIMKLRNLKKDVPTSNPAIMTALPIPPKPLTPSWSCL